MRTENSSEEMFCISTKAIRHLIKCEDLLLFQIYVSVN